MSILSRSVAAVLLAGALALGTGRLTPSGARADFPEFAPGLPEFAPHAPEFAPHPPEFTPLCGPFVSPLGSNVQWDGPAARKLQEEFVVESARYVPEERRFSWTLRTRRSFPGELAEAEKKLGETLATAWKDTGFSAYFYDGQGRKVGIGEIFFQIGERRLDNTFSVFADLNLHNADLIATRAIIVLSERPRLPEPPTKDGKDGKNGKEGKQPEKS